MTSFFRIAMTVPLILSAHVAMGQERNLAWAPSEGCKINTHDAITLYSDALTALKHVSVDHRITQALNPSKAASNYHGADAIQDGMQKAGAVDLSVRCLSQADVRSLLSRLTDEGYVAWYRNPSADGWTGAPHIHAVWVTGPLKRQLRRQVNSWIQGRNGLVGDARYGFWQPSKDQRDSIIKLNSEVVKTKNP